MTIDNSTAPVVERWTAREAEALRLALGWAPEVFATCTGVSPSTVRRWKAKPGTVPAPAAQKSLAALLLRTTRDERSRFARSIQPVAPSSPAPADDDRPVRRTPLGCLVHDALCHAVEYPDGRVEHVQGTPWSAACRCGHSYGDHAIVLDDDSTRGACRSCECAGFIDDRAVLVAGLRELADFLEAHPNVPVPPAWSSINTITVLPPDDDERRAFVDAFAAALGVEAADPGNHGHYKATRKFGPIGYESFAISTAASARAAARASYADVIRLDDAAVAA